MDPISFVFSVYLDAIQSRVHTQLTDTLGTEVKAVMIGYEGVDVPFQYQMWRVRDNSVCSSNQPDLIKYSQCTVKAKKLFQNLCGKLSENPSTHWRYTKTKNMYCNAAVSYQPTVARITEAEEKTEVEEARASCNLAIAGALGSRDPVVIAKRDRVCSFDPKQNN